jgi:cytochrome c oxidase subunit 2
MFYSLLKHRKSQGYKAANFHHSTTVEIIWTVIPFVILIAMALPATKTVIAMKDTSSPDITIKTTGYQWKWGYDYITGEGEGISFLSALATPKAQIENAQPKGENYLLEVDNPLVVPVGKKVAPADRQRRASRLVGACSGRSRTPYRAMFGTGSRSTIGHLSRPVRRLCGKEHGFMPIIVEAVTPEKYTSGGRTEEEIRCDGFRCQQNHGGRTQGRR